MLRIEVKEHYRTGRLHLHIEAPEWDSPDLAVPVGTFEEAWALAQAYVDENVAACATSIGDNVRRAARALGIDTTVSAGKRGSRRIEIELPTLAELVVTYGAHRVHPDAALAGKFVYFVGEDDPERPIKIGYTTCFPSRRKALQTAVPHELKTYLVLSCSGPELETALHAAFGGSRLTGEWFARSEALDAFIAAFKLDRTVKDDQ
jgi:hypothetical protein